MATNHDNVIYLETDEDITSAIDKVRGAAGESVQIVMPKRATLMQSLINQKLLKKAADKAGKSVSLITTDPVASNLASRTGLAVAAKVGAAAAVPVVAAAKMASDEIDGGAVETAAPIAAAAAVAAKPNPAPEAAQPSGTVEPPKVQQTQNPLEAAPIQRTPLAPAKASKPAKKSAVPNFTKAQKRIIWGIVAVLVLAAAFIANILLTSAQVNLFAKASKSPVAFDFTADPSTSKADLATATIPATQLKVDKTVSGSTPATGKKDVGTKASGTMTVSNGTGVDQPLQAGTRFVSGDKIFRSTSDVTVPAATLDKQGNKVRKSVSVGVTADANGDQYNLAPTSYSIPGLGGGIDVTAQGGQMQGGTTKTQSVVSQADVDKAAATAIEAAKDDAKKAVDGKAGKDQVVLDGSFVQKPGAVNANPAVGSEASQVSVSVPVVYTELAVSKQDLQNLVKAQAQKVVGANNQVYDDGFGNLVVTGNGTTKFNGSTNAYAGPKIDTAELAKQMKGKKYGEAENIANQTPGVEKSEIKLSPSWATNMPTSVKRIKITVKPSDTSGN